jgi:signal transduction histidine kinase/ligand-binding sensor domain-containing protein
MARPGIMRVLRGSIASGVLLVLSAQAHGQRLPITYYSTSDGLAHYAINRIVRDSRGFLWFCTRAGLSRFDGREFVNWGVDDGLPIGDVNDLIETRDGTFWIATERGLVRFNPNGRREAGDQNVHAAPMFTTYVPSADPRSARVSSLQHDPSGALWVGTAAGLFRADISGEGVAFTAVDLNVPDVLQARSIGSLFVDRFGVLWIGTNSRVYRLEPAGGVDVLGEADGIPVQSVSRILEDNAGTIWLTPMGGGLLQLTNEPHARPRVVRHLTSQDGFPSGGASDLMQDSRGMLWVATGSALVRVAVDRSAGSTVALQTIGEREGLHALGFSALAEDLHGNVWTDVFPYGVAKLSRSGFTAFSPGDQRALFMSLVEARNGDLVAFSESGGKILASRFDGQSFRPIAGARPPVSASWAWNQIAFQDRGGGWWFGGNEGVVRYAAGIPLERIAPAKPVAKISSADGLAADTIIRLFEDRRGNVWIGTVGQGVVRNGLALWRGGAPSGLVQFSEADGLPPLDRHYVSSFVSDRAGDVWIGFSGDAGLARYDGTRFVRFAANDGVPPGQIRNLALDSAGRVWAATYRGGVASIEHPESEHPRFHAYTTHDGLSSNETTAVVEAAAGEMYIGTARGLDKLSVETGQITHFTATDGLPATEMWGALRDAKGVLWFVYSDAILRLVPDAAQSAPPAPEIFVTGISVDGRPRDVSAVGDRAIENLQLRSGGSMRIDLVAPWFGTADGVLYQYRLRERDTWSAPSLQRSITFASLAPGRYTFTARAITNQGRTSASDATVAFTVVAPVWRRSWFVLLTLSTIGALTYVVSRRRVARLLEVANMRTRIATDLHDDIGANLTRIAVLSEVARQRHALAGGTEDPLASIAALSRESVTAMADIVWAISPDRDQLADLVRKMREHADDLLSACDVRLTFTVVGVLQDERIELDVRRDVFLIFKEAVNNAARHSGCDAVEVTFGTENGSLVLSIADNGKGFDPAAEAEGNGLVNMRRRAARIAGKLDVLSEPGSATTIRLVMPLRPHRRSQRLLS